MKHRLWGSRKLRLVSDVESQGLREMRGRKASKAKLRAGFSSIGDAVVVGDYHTKKSNKRKLHQQQQGVRGCTGKHDKTGRKLTSPLCREVAFTTGMTERYGPSVGLNAEIPPPSPLLEKKIKI